MKKRIFSLLLAAATMACLLTGCGDAEPDQTVTDLPDVGQTGTSSSSGAAQTIVAAEDMTKQLTGVEKDAVVGALNDETLSAEVYCFWLYKNTDYMKSYYEYATEGEMDWDSEDFINSGMSTDKFLREYALESAMMYNVLWDMAREYGCELTAGQEIDYISTTGESMKTYGGEEGFNTWLQSMCISREGYDYINQTSYLYDNLSNYFYGENGTEKPTDATIARYIEDNDLLSAKHILLLTVDTSQVKEDKSGYVSLDEETIAEKRTLAEKLVRELKNSEDPEVLFDALMNQYSEDSGLASNPNGYNFTAGQMVKGFEDGTRALEIGQISDVVESEYGFHIILRQSADNEETRANWTDEQMDAKLADWYDNAQRTTTEAYEQFSAHDYYDKLNAWQEQLLASMQSAETSGS